MRIEPIPPPPSDGGRNHIAGVASPSPRDAGRNGARPGEQRSHAVIARDLWVSYNGRTAALRGVDIQVAPGTMAMVVGRSGAGKTTLLRVIAGLLTPARGSVSFDDDAGPHRRGRVAYVPQTLGLVRSMTAFENAVSGALADTGTLRSLARMFPKEATERAAATLAKLGLESKLHQRVYNLSGGERQRVAIARALMQQPDMILADEFVSQLDPVTTGEILEQMRGVAASGVSLLITTHETDLVTKYADQLIVLRAGEKAYDGHPAGLSLPEMMELLR